MLDFVRSEPGDDPIIVEGYFAATPEKVFHAWTDPDYVMKWFGQSPNSLFSAKIDLRPGGNWQFLKSKDADKAVGFEGEYIDIERDKRLLFSWSHVVAHTDGKRDETPFSQVEVTFTAKGGGTDVRVIHSAIRDSDARRGVGGGWNAAFNHLSDLFGNMTD
jgi:uncharacterized protein YndB with AHSA1/START domain